MFSQVHYFVGEFFESVKEENNGDEIQEDWYAVENLPCGRGWGIRAERKPL